MKKKKKVIIMITFAINNENMVMKITKSLSV